MTAVSTAQALFLVAFAVVVALVTFFVLYVASSALWANRWTRHGRGAK